MSQNRTINTNMSTHLHSTNTQTCMLCGSRSVNTVCEPSLKVDWRTKAGMVMRPETSVGRGTKLDGGDLYLPGKCFPLWSSSTVLSIYIPRSVKCFKVLLLITLITVLSSEWTEQWQGPCVNYEGGLADSFQSAMCDVCRPIVILL